MSQRNEQGRPAQSQGSKAWGALMVAVGLLGACQLAPAADETTNAATNEPGFTHTRYEDFAAGTLGNAGQNLFVSRQGQLQFINWFDLNADGYPEIVINNDQNPYENVDAMIYYNRPRQGLRSLLPPMSDDTPPFQRLQWMQRSLESIDFLPTLGGGNSLVVDLNADGYPDIVFSNFIHGWAKRHFPVFIYWGGPDGYNPARRTELPSLEARGLIAVDLTGNGRLDLVLANYGMEYHASETFHGDQYESWIYWQDEYGFSEENRSSIPTAYALDVAAADLNGDGQLELIFLNGQPESTVRIFQQKSGQREYDTDNWQELPVHDAGFSRGLTNRLLVADLNNNGQPDLLVTSRGTASQIFWNDNGLSPEHQTDLPTHNAYGTAAVDLNGDGWKDLVIANNRYQDENEKHHYNIDSYIYWGGPQGFSPERRTGLPTLGAVGVAVGDLTGNGYPDIVFANYHDDERYDVPSYIYLGSEQGYSPLVREELYAFGPVDVQLADLTGDGRLDVFVMNRQSGNVSGRGNLPSYIYWGNERGEYATTNASRLDVQNGYSSNAADLNNDGHADLVFTTSRSLTIAYSQNGEYLQHNIVRYDMPYRGMTSNIADFNNDGYLDILVGGLHSEEPNLAIFFGNADGFDEPRYYDVGMGVIASAVADISGDGQLEIILGGRSNLQIIPLTTTGEPDLANAYHLEVNRQTQRIALADLDNNGRLDLIASHYRDYNTKRLNSPSAIYWNRDGQLSATDRTDLPTTGGHWVTVADVFNTGQLDLLFSNYHGERRRDIDLFIYSPDEQGNYGQHRRTVPALSSSANLVMDFTGNGHNDLLVVNHTGPNLQLGLWPISGIHGVGSYLYEGSPEGFSIERRRTLPSFGPHKIINAEPGDIARRRDYETYTSPDVTTALPAGQYVLEVQGNYNFRTSVSVRFRIADTDTWHTAELLDHDGETYRFAVNLAEPADRFAYQLRLHTGGSGTGPIVDTVRLHPRQ